MSNVVEAVHESYAKDRRARVLAGHFNQLIPHGSRVLDVGTGDGSIAAAVQADRPDLSIQGLEFQVREDCAVPVEAFNGREIPHPDDSFDYVSFLDVLHHTTDPLVLLEEAVRVARKGVLIKDHLLQGFLAGATLGFMDRVGNRRYGIDLPNTYWTRSRWEEAFRQFGLVPGEFRRDLGLYPPWANWLFGRGLHFFARLERVDAERDDSLEYWHPGLSCCNERWEAAYNRFETPEEERLKFGKRFKELNLPALPRYASIVDIFCGRGNGLIVLREMGFRDLTGVDLSPELIAQCPPTVRRIVADCTDLKFPPGSVDAFIVQGGLHHLPLLPEDLVKCLEGVSRALKPGGRFYVVEPWNTPFLRFVHWITRKPLVRRWNPRFDAFATMVEEEWETYQQWLTNGPLIKAAFAKVFPVLECRFAWGKCRIIARKPPES